MVITFFIFRKLNLFVVARLFSLITPRFFRVGSGLHFKFIILFFVTIGWSALWLSQTVLVFKLAHNGLRLKEVADLEH